MFLPKKSRILIKIGSKQWEKDKECVIPPGKGKRKEKGKIKAIKGGKSLKNPGFRPRFPVFQQDLAGRQELIQGES